MASPGQLWQNARVHAADEHQRSRDVRVGAGLLTAVVATGLALRLIHLRQIHAAVMEAPPGEHMDRWLGLQVASAILDGDWLGGWAVAYDSSPAYDYFLAGVYRVFGTWDAVVLLQVGLGAIVPLLLYDVGRRLWSARVGLVAALLAALYVPAIFYEGLTVKYGLLPFALAGVLWAAVRLRTGAGAWAMGIFSGVLLLLRPNAALLLPLVVGWAVATKPWSARVRTVAAVVGVTALVFAPMAVRDAIAARHHLVSALGGLHFYLGTNPDADGEYVILPGVRPDIIGHVVDARRLAEKRAGRRLTPSEVSRYWFDQGLAFVREQPGRYALLTIRKLWFAFEADEAGSFGDDYETLAPASGVLRLPAVNFGTLVPFAFIGIAAAVRRRAWLVPLAVVGTLASILPFFLAGRYRVLLVPPMIVAAAVGLDAVRAWLPRHGWIARALAVAGILLTAIVFGATDVQVIGLVVIAAVSLVVLQAFVSPHEPAHGAT